MGVFQLHTSDKTSPRSFSWLWFIRLAAIVLSIIVLGVTANATSTFNSALCHAPSKLSYNLAVAVISIVFLAYLLLSTGPVPALRVLPWIIFGEIAIEGLLFVFWIAAAGTSRYNCDDLCNACHGGGGYVDYGDLDCTCFFFYKRDTTPWMKTPLEKRSLKTRRDDNSASVNDTRTAFDSILTVLLFVCLVCSILWLFQNMKGDRSGTNTTTAPVGTQPVKHEEAGLPATGAVAPSLGQGDPNYNNQIPLQSQPMQQQSYPPQNSVPQNYPQQTYPQGQQPQYAQQPYQQSQPVQQQSYPEYSAMNTQQSGGQMQPQNYPPQTTSPPPQSYPQQAGSPPPPQAYPGQPNNFAAPREGTQEMHSPAHEAPKPSVSPEVAPAPGPGTYAGT